MTIQKISTPLKVGALSLKHRVVLAPLTRLRALPPHGVPHDLNAEYYEQRASEGGLLISEATNISQQAIGYKNSPGIWLDEHVQGWKKVTERVHGKGGYIFLQLWHTGRVAIPELCGPKGPVGPSAIAVKDYQVPRVLEIPEIKSIVQDYRHAAALAKEAGFDGVEIHAANGYLIDQFLRDGSNERTDEYGGSFENRTRFLLEVVDATLTVFSADRVGVRLAPATPFLDMSDSRPKELFSHVLKELEKYNLAYTHLVEPRISGGGDIATEENIDLNAAFFRKVYSGVLITAGGFDAKSGPEIVESGAADAVAFGRYFISNPDLPERVRIGAPFTPYNRKTFYSSGAEGYTDYPTYAEQEKADATPQ